MFLCFLMCYFDCFIQESVGIAIVISAVSGLVDYEGAIFLWRVDKRDFTLWAITSTTTLFFGIEIGVLIGVSWFCTCFCYTRVCKPSSRCLGASSRDHCVQKHKAVSRSIHLQRDCDCSNLCSHIFRQHKLYQGQATRI